MSKLRFLIAFLAVGIAAPAWSQEVHLKDPVKCDPKDKGHCVSAVVFTSTRDGGPAEIYLQVMNEDNTANTHIAPIRLTENEGGGNAFPALSPKGKTTVFDSNRLRPPVPVPSSNPPVERVPGNVSDLFVMNADGTDQRPLTVTPEGTPRGGTSATWSPDGKWIAFHRSASGNACPNPLEIVENKLNLGCPIKDDPGAASWDSDIFVMRVHEADEPVGDPINITNSACPIDPDSETPKCLPMGYISDDPDWSPDGRKIVFTRHTVQDNQVDSVTAEICVLELETPNAGPTCYLGGNGQEERATAWSPDGTEIAYMCRREPLPSDPPNLMPGRRFEICVMNEDGTGQTQLTTNSVLDGTPTWSPDGKSIVFSRLLVGPPDPFGPQSYELFVMNLEDGGETRVTNTSGVNFLSNWGELWVGGEAQQ